MQSLFLARSEPSEDARALAPPSPVLNESPALPGVAVGPIPPYRVRASHKSRYSSPTGIARFCVTVLAIGATATSAGIATVAGWDRGGQLTERLAWIFIGLVLLLSAHLIPALSRGLPAFSRSVAMVLWACAMVATGYGHATFFVIAQQHAGEARASNLPIRAPSVISASGRAPSVIAGERANVEKDLAVANAQKCRDICTWLSLRKQSLTARLNALNIEFDEAKRNERLADKAAAERDRVNAQRDSALADPVTALVARVLGAASGTVNLVVALSFGWLLEGVGCLGWLLALPRGQGSKSASSNVETVARPVMRYQGSAVVTAQRASNDESNGTSNGTSNAGNKPSNVMSNVSIKAASNGSVKEAGTVIAMTRDSTPTPQTRPAAVIADTAEETIVVRRHPVTDLERLAAACDEGRVRPTVVEIRRFLRCSQARAQEARKMLLSLKPESANVT